jgi:DNA-binding helix-hairpin-helix protein with protein kinase domain
MSERVVTDENGTVHALEYCLGEGAQGAVWRTRNGRRVVKLFSRTRDREALRRQIAFVKRLDLRDLHVARPLALLRPPEVGYVAEFLSDMVSLRSLLAPPRGQGVDGWYLATGGLQRRLRLLAHVGEALAGLHARGLIYGDISHNNVFVSGPVEASEAWLIDLDNLRHDSDPENAVYTPGYGAPEVVSGRQGPSSLSDAWGFAVLAFHTLSLIHPFCGDLVTEGDPELEEKAFAARVPWVDHSADARNRSSHGIAREQVLGPQLLTLARETFEDGANNSLKRPGVGRWVERLHLAADQTVACTHCAQTFFVSAQACPWCGSARPLLAQVSIQRWEPGRGIVEAMGTVARLPLAGAPVQLTRRHTRGESGLRAREVEFSLEPRERGVLVRPHDVPAWVTPPGKQAAVDTTSITSRGRILPLEAPDRSWVVHFDNVDTPHRVAVISRGIR